MKRSTTHATGENGDTTISNTFMWHMTSRSADETARLGERIGARLHRGDSIYLSGDLGAGKTALTRGIVRGWGAVERATSPTFVFAHEHHRARDDMKLYHVDCYRLRGPEDAESIGLDEMLNGDHIVVIEWPERVAALLPSEALHVQIEIGEMQDGRETRLLTLRAVGERAAALLSDVKGEAD